MATQKSGALALAIVNMLAQSNTFPTLHALRSGGYIDLEDCRLQTIAKFYLSQSVT